MDVVSLGIGQDAQANFFHPERQDPRRTGADGVPVSRITIEGANTRHSLEWLPRPRHGIPCPDCLTLQHRIEKTAYSLAGSGGCSITQAGFLGELGPSQRRLTTAAADRRPGAPVGLRLIRCPHNERRMSLTFALFAYTIGTGLCRWGSCNSRPRSPFSEAFSKLKAEKEVTERCGGGLRRSSYG